MSQEETEARISILSNEDDALIEPLLRLLGKKGITIVISKKLAKQIAKLQIDGDDEYCEVGTFPLCNGYETSKEKSVVKIVIEEGENK